MITVSYCNQTGNCSNFTPHGSKYLKILREKDPSLKLCAHARVVSLPTGETVEYSCQILQAPIEMSQQSFDLNTSDLIQGAEAA
ncbi:MAG: hypothetical protein COU22_02505 [Candidatus Komeilibacteria bacterium CG10_big_fil_rev_8_21_14_0_10_41_13]|uniref:Uncharacterized protein n=1 Tax=Candidatus Komeilibacteria bacterium CG10_big_fil_rev_8_21_14_0_10_41_13 TaxID=1974476 RepID=A0A2M6WC88_9BACT|nr:MAG: hypothetical protein COU22_02505 [Candidatus Komeilibacteria bacterium CG10_big_fil_rev_8_21_14_0_10_41_13]